MDGTPDQGRDPAPNRFPGERHWLGPLRSRGLRLTIAAAISFFLAVRAIELALPAWAQQHNSPLLSGVLLSCVSVGSVAGGLLLGALPARWSGRATLPVTLTVLCLGAVLVAAVSFTWVAVLIAAVTLMGLALGPSFVALWATAGDLSPADMAAETQSWITLFMSLGGAVGVAVGSVVVHALGSGALLALAAGALAIASWLARLATAGAPVPPERAPDIDVHRVMTTGGGKP